jgi:subtilase family serine protease
MRYDLGTGAEGLHNQPPNMTTATLISKIDDKSFDLTSGKHSISVFVGESFTVVYAGKGVGTGRVFHQETNAERLAAAINSYKSAGVKSALESLADYLA